MASVAAIVPLMVACSDGAGPSEADPKPDVSGLVVAWDGSEVTARGAAVFAPGDTIHLLVDATDNRRVRWVGIHVVQPFDAVDSVEVMDSLVGVRVTAQITTSASFVGLLQVNAFAWDDRGQRTETSLDGNPVSVYASVVRPVASASLDAAVRDVALDLKRDRAYLSEPDSGRVAVYTLSTATFQQPFVPPAPPAGLDLSVSGDSLIAALPAIRKLGILDLSAQSPAWTTLDLAFDTSMGRRPDKLRVAASGRVIVSITATGFSGAVGKVLEYDLSSGYQTVRTDVSYFDGYPGVVTEATPMARSTDRSRILLIFDNSCCPEQGQVYVSQTNSFLPRQPTVQLYGPPMSSNGSGSLFLVGRTLFDGALTSPVTYYPPGSSRPSALSENGDTAFFTLGAGLLRTRVADGATLERVLLPQAPVRLFNIPGLRQRLLILSDSTIAVASLDSSANASSSLSHTPYAPPNRGLKLTVHAPSFPGGPLLSTARAARSLSPVR